MDRDTKAKLQVLGELDQQQQSVLNDLVEAERQRGVTEGRRQMRWILRMGSKLGAFAGLALLCGWMLTPSFIIGFEWAHVTMVAAVVGLSFMAMNHVVDSVVDGKGPW